jgi:hypothetical protein
VFAPVRVNEDAVSPESTLESAQRRSFIKKAAFATAATAVGATILGGRIVPESSAFSCNTFCNVNVDHPGLNNGAALRPGIQFGVPCSGEGISSNRTCSSLGDKNGLDFWTDYKKRFGITNGGLVVIDPIGSGVNSLNPGPGLEFGQFGSGEGMTSNRTIGCVSGPGNKFGLDFYTNSIKRMSLNNAGNLGIATCTPISTLDVRGSLNVEGIPTSGIQGLVTVTGSVKVSCCFSLTGTAFQSTSVYYGIGVQGTSCGGTGVVGKTKAVAGYGVMGCSPCGIGVFGKGNGAGIEGVSCMGYGVLACGPIGVYGNSNTQEGVFGAGKTAGVKGVTSCISGYGVVGCALCSIGVLGSAGKGTGVKGSSSGIGVQGVAGKIGVQGVASSPTSIPIVAQAAVGQTSHMQEWQKSCGKALTVIDQYGNLGVGSSKPNTTLQVAGGISLKIATVTANYSMKASDFTVLANASSAALTVTLPHASTSGLIVNIKKIDSSGNAVTIAAASGDNIETASTKTLSTRFASYQLQADGVHTWYVVATGT